MTFLLALLIIVAVHEYGHYFAFRMYGVHVERFAVGFGPVLFSRNDRNGTEWSLRVIPLGGYVLPNQEGAEKLSPLKTIVMAAAGPLANLLMAGLLVTIMIGDFKGFAAVFLLSADLYVATFKAVWNLLTFSGVNDLSGPIGMIKAGSDKDNMTWLMSFAWMLVTINIGIALFNLLPIPVLDGGRILLAFIELFVGRDAMKKATPYAMGVGVVLLLAIFLIVTVNDILR